MTQYERIRLAEELANGGFISATAGAHILAAGNLYGDPLAGLGPQGLWGFGVGSAPATPPPRKVGDILEDLQCRKCGNKGHIRVHKLEFGKTHATCKLCGTQVEVTL